VVGSDIANRNHVEIEGLIGFFSNMLVLRVDLSGNPTFRQLLERVREMSLEAYANQDVPFEKLVEVIQPRRQLSHSPLFQVVFTLQNAPAPTLELRGLTLRQLEVDYGAAKFDLVLNMWEHEHGLIGSLEYNTDLFAAATITRMLGHFEELLKNIILHPNTHLDSLEIFSAEERNVLDASTTIEELDESFSFQSAVRTVTR
jgi:non-ribosomal peptide synthetase component F